MYKVKTVEIKTSKVASQCCIKIRSSSMFPAFVAPVRYGHEFQLTFLGFFFVGRLQLFVLLYVSDTREKSLSVSWLTDSRHSTRPFLTLTLTSCYDKRHPTIAWCFSNCFRFVNFSTWYDSWLYFIANFYIEWLNELNVVEIVVNWMSLFLIYLNFSCVQLIHKSVYRLNIWC